MLEIKKIQKLYESGNGLYETDLVLRDGELTGILGRNGSGKTTLLKCVLSLCALDRGEILFHGKAVNKQYDEVAFISADGSSLPYMRVKEYGRFLAQYYRYFDKESYQKLCKRLELSENARICHLSKGQKMKVEIAAGFSMNAKLLVLDEPFTSLDMYAREDVIRLLIEQLKEDVVILVSTHDIEEIEQIADRCVVLEKGKVVEDLRMDELHEQGVELKAYLEKYRPNS